MRDNTTALSGLRPLDGYEPPADNELAEELARFLRDRYDEQERAAQSTAYMTTAYNRPCPRCGKPVTGLDEPVSTGATRLVRHGDVGFTGACELSAAEWQTFVENGLTDDARFKLADIHAKRRILDEIDVQALGAVHLRKLLALPFAEHPDYRAEWRL